ncbi:hypothetical protein HA466_0302920 [Hirschfeldia incana]|nr:hypothetical protein HA466_0302920 [Hirschfeldia incana]
MSLSSMRKNDSFYDFPLLSSVWLSLEVVTYVNGGCGGYRLSVLISRRTTHELSSLCFQDLSFGAGDHAYFFP